MQNFILPGIGAGISSALLAAPSYAGSFAAIFVYFIVSLPLYAAGFGWGWRAALIGSITGSLITAILFDLFSAVFFFGFLGATPVVISYLALLARQPDGNQAGNTSQLEWYPVSNLLMWLGGIISAVTIIQVLAIGTSYPAYSTNLGSIIDAILNIVASQPDAPQVPEETKNQIVQLAILTFPSLIASMLFISHVINVYFAAKLVNRIGKLQRPWPNLHALELPDMVRYALIVFLLLLLAPGMISVLASAVATVGLSIAGLVGLSVLHSLTVGNGFRAVLLGGLYFVTFLMGWPAIILSMLGMFDKIFDFRGLKKNDSGQNGPPPIRRE